MLLDFFSAKIEGVWPESNISAGGRGDIPLLLQCYCMKNLFARIDRAAGRVGAKLHPSNLQL